MSRDQLVLDRRQVPAIENAVGGRGDGVTDAASFISRKAALRANPLNTNYINWPYFTNNYATTDQHGSNLINVNDACASLRQIGVNILVCLTLSEGTFTIADANDWAGKWELWQHCYAEAFYLARFFEELRVVNGYSDSGGDG